MGATSHKDHTHGGYHAGHPWYYLLGGTVLTPKQVRDAVLAGNYRGYLADEIERRASLHEPRRTERLDQIRQEIIAELKADIARYRQCVLELHAERRQKAHSYCDQGVNSSPVCTDIHVSVALKHNHIFNGFAHLALLDELPAPSQGDLFDL